MEKVVQILAPKLKETNIYIWGLAIIVSIHFHNPIIWMYMNHSIITKNVINARSKLLKL